MVNRLRGAEAGYGRGAPPRTELGSRSGRLQDPVADRRQTEGAAPAAHFADPLAGRVRLPPTLRMPPIPQHVGRQTHPVVPDARGGLTCRAGGARTRSTGALDPTSSMVGSSVRVDRPGGTEAPARTSTVGGASPRGSRSSHHSRPRRREGPVHQAAGLGRRPTPRVVGPLRSLAARRVRGGVCHRRQR